MITFSICLVALILGYFIYGRFVEKSLAPMIALRQPLHMPMAWTT